MWWLGMCVWTCRRVEQMAPATQSGCDGARSSAASWQRQALLPLCQKVQDSYLHANALISDLARRSRRHLQQKSTDGQRISTDES